MTESTTLPAVMRDLPRFDALLLQIEIILGDLAEGPIEDRHLVLDAKAKVGILIESFLARRVDVGGL